MAKRRTTYKVERIMNLGGGDELHPICETNDKHHFFQFLDQLYTDRPSRVVVKETSRAVVVRY